MTNCYHCRIDRLLSMRYNISQREVMQVMSFNNYGREFFYERTVKGHR